MTSDRLNRKVFAWSNCMSLSHTDLSKLKQLCQSFACLSNNLDITLLTIKVVSTFCEILQKWLNLRSQKVLLTKKFQFLTHLWLRLMQFDHAKTFLFSLSEVILLSIDVQCISIVYEKMVAIPYLRLLRRLVYICQPPRKIDRLYQYFTKCWYYFYC
jgi:hypothetical protein